MLTSLVTRLIGLFITLMVIILMVFTWYVSKSSLQNQLQMTQALHQDLAKNMIKENHVLRDGKIDPAILEHVFHSMMLLGPAFEIYVVDLDGEILAFSAIEGKVKRKNVNLEPIKSFLNKNTAWPLLGDDPRHQSRQKIFSAAKIYQIGKASADDETSHQGYLYVIIGSELQDTIIQNLLSNKIADQSVAIFVGTLLFAMLGSIILILVITKPLRTLTNKVVNYHQGEGWHQGQLLDHKVKPLQQCNEVEQLNHVINQMATTIGQQFEQLASVDLQRKELLSYISHDLRTPLASLTGYLETWLAQQSDQSTQQHYIEVALRNAKTLNVLVEQVFELAHLESGSVELTREPVAVAELAQDIIESFKLRAVEAGVSLDVTPRDSSIQVDADIAKLERVLGNLVANAIRHTPKGGNIVISFESVQVEHQRRILIKVTDTGTGIPADALPRVFEAHFRAANIKDGQSGNAGLGLAIVKALLALHQTDIGVTSVEEEGTIFSFSLPQYTT